MFWNIRSFEDYIKEDMNLPGLRVQIFPTLEGLDTAFKLAWEKILQTCSNDMIQLLITEYGRRSEVLDKDINIICSQLQTFKTHNTFSERENKLKKHLESFNKEVLIKKDNKFRISTHTT